MVETGIKCTGWSGEYESNNAERFHMNTRYEEEELNYATLCPECREECEKYWATMWADYYRECM